MLVIVADARYYYGNGTPQPTKYYDLWWNYQGLTYFTTERIIILTIYVIMYILPCQRLTVSKCADNS